MEQIERDPFHVQLHLTTRCNLACKHCYEGAHNVIDEWDYDELILVLKNLELAFEKWQVLGEISLVGGEPTLYPYINEVIKYIYGSKSINRFAILTNGVSISDELYDVMCQTRPTVQVSVDGINEEKHDFIRGKGNYQRTINNIRRLVEANIPVYVHYVLSKYTIPITWEYIEYMDELGVSQITFSRDVPIGNSNQEIMLSRYEMKEVFDSLNEYSDRLQGRHLKINTSRPLWACYGKSGRCPVGIQTLTILQDGTVYPCRRLPISLGNIKTDSIYKIWYESDLLWDVRNRNRIDGCGQCKYVDECGGARCIAYAVTGNYMSADPQCWRL